MAWTAPTWTCTARTAIGFGWRPHISTAGGWNGSTRIRLTSSAVPYGIVLATGSVAFDYILTFNGRFRDHIMPDQVHILNLSFLVDRFERRRGGVGAKYASTLALLGQPSAILATAGADAAEYRGWLEGLGVECSGLKLLEGETTATGFTTTDLDDNQITGYYGGAMNRAGEGGLADTAVTPAAGIVGANGPGGGRPARAGGRG